MKPVTALLSGLLIGGPLLTEGLLAAEWQREAGISLGAYYSDNICLSDDEDELKGRGAATVTPNVRITGQGARANLSLDGSLRYNSLADSNLNCSTGQSAQLTNRESVIPSLRYRGDLELIEDWLTLESDASATTNSIDPFAPGDPDRFDGRDNINITYQYGAGATIQRRLFDSADMRLHYYHNEQQNGASVLGDSSEDRGEFDLGTERGNNRLSVGIGGRYSRITYEGNERRPAFDNTLSSAEVRAALQLSTSWQINGLVGEEWNEFTSARPDIDGSYWDAGLRWAPNDRVEVNIGTGERFFGTTPRASIRYRHKRSEVTVDYSRSLTVPRNLRVPDQDFDDPLAPAPGQLPGDPPVLVGQPTFIDRSPIINERLSVRYRFSARRTTITVNASDSRQLRTEDAGEATFSNLGLTFSRSLSTTLSANARLSWSGREGQGNDVGFFGEESETWRAGLDVSRRLGSNTTMNLGYEHTRREADSDAAFNQYEENRITLSARHQF